MTRDEILRENKRGGGMFAVIPSVVMLDEELPASAKLLYGVITWRSGKYGFCWATNDVLGADVGISGKRVSPLITLLENRGHIETELLLNTALSGGKQRNIYPVVKSARGLAGCMLKNEDTLSSKMRRGSPQKRGDGILKNEEQKKKNKYINIPPIVPHDVADVLLDYCGEDEQLLSALCGLLENRAKVNRSKTVMSHERHPRPARPALRRRPRDEARAAGTGDHEQLAHGLRAQAGQAAARIERRLG